MDRSNKNEGKEGDLERIRESRMLLSKGVDDFFARYSDAVETVHGTLASQDHYYESVAFDFSYVGKGKMLAEVQRVTDADGRLLREAFVIDHFNALGQPGRMKCEVVNSNGITEEDAVFYEEVSADQIQMRLQAGLEEGLAAIEERKFTKPEALDQEINLSEYEEGQNPALPEKVQMVLEFFQTQPHEVLGSDEYARRFMAAIRGGADVSEEIGANYSPEELRGMLAKFCEITPEGDIHVLDPLTNRRVDVNHPPDYILEDSMIRKGLAALKRLSQEGRFDVTLILGNHGGVNQLQEAAVLHGDAIEDAAVVAVETNWDAVVVYNAEEWLNPFPKFDSGRRGEYQAAQVAYLQSQGIENILPCDIDKPTFGIRAELLSLLNLADLASENPDLSEVEKKQFEDAALLSYHYNRQWGMWGQLGYWLERLEEEGQLPEGDITFMAGPVHEALVDKYFALTGKIPEIRRTHPINQEWKNLVNAMRTGRLYADGTA